METQVLPVNKQSIALAVKLLQQGQVVAIPTETVYGLAASALNGQAVRRIFEAKGRPQDNPLISHISGLAMLPMVARQVPKEAHLLAEAFWPGPLTMVLPRAAGLADEVCAGLDTAGVRMPKHPAALQIIQAAGVPLAAPSANVSGRPSPTTAAHVLADMRGKIPLIIDGGASQVGIESTVVALLPEPLVLRPGAVTAEDMQRVLKCPVELANAVSAPLAAFEKVQSPGMKYKHYAPKAKITIIEGDLPGFIGYLKTNAKQGVYALCFEGEQTQLPVPALAYGSEIDDASQAAGLFSALHKLDEEGAKIVYARSPKASGVGFAVYNRLLRAAAFRVVQV